MHTHEVSNLVLAALQQVVANPEHQPEQVAELFSRDYRQNVDGNLMNYEQFMQHMALLKQITRSMTVDILAIAAEGMAVLTHHVVNVEKRDGSRSKISVLAHFTVSDGRIQSCDELTRLLTGSHADSDLGSRR